MTTGAGVVGWGVTKMMEIVSVGVTDGVKVGVIVGVCDGRKVGEGVRLKVALAVWVKVRVGLGVMLATGDGVRVAVGVLLLLGAFEGVRLGLGVVVTLVTPADGVWETFAVWLAAKGGVAVMIVTRALGVMVALAAVVTTNTAFEVAVGLLGEVALRVCGKVAVNEAAAVTLWVTAAAEAVKVGLGESFALIAVSVKGVSSTGLEVTAAAGVV